MRRRYVTSAAINLASNATASLLSAVSILIVIRTLNIVDWGRTAVLLGLGQLMGNVLSFGTPARLIRELSTQTLATYRKVAFSLTLARTLTGSAILIAGFLILTAINADVGSVLVLAAGVFVSLGSTAAFIARRRYVAAAILLLSEKLSALASLAILARSEVLTPAMFLCVLGLAGVLAGWLAAGMLHNGCPSFRGLTSAIRGQWVGSLHFGIAAVAPAFLLLDTVIVAHASGAAEAGAYAVGSRLLAPLSVVSTTLAQTLMPVLAVQGPAARLAFPARRQLIILLTCVLCALSALTVIVPSLAVVVLGPEYSASSWPIRFFILNAMAVLFTRALATALQAWHYESLVSKLIGINVVVALIAVLLGAFYGGAGPAAAGILAANIVLAASLAIAACRVRRRSLETVASP
ncbi:lipopolysaccharide biosynthesis protein [Nakamurella sp.]|uniref:lipopolysaccharide biosynthesis protein n=1 Tax=Nakamurella sp. TaxID=1869182 RepID=UPI0037839531